jgi:hypothetical protein
MQISVFLKPCLEAGLGWCGVKFKMFKITTPYLKTMNLSTWGRNSKDDKNIRININFKEKSPFTG